MTEIASTVDPTAVGKYYDRITELLSVALGGSLHIGYWPDNENIRTVEEASRRLTRLMIEKLAVRTGDRVLDIGCGAGRPAVDLARATGADVVGVTVSERQVELATNLATQEGLSDQVRFQQADAQALPFEAESFHSAWLFESLFHVPDQALALREAARVLRPGGRLVIANVFQRAPMSPQRQREVQPYHAALHIAELFPLAAYPKLLSDSGLRWVESIDISDESIHKKVRDLDAAPSELEEQLMAKAFGTGSPDSAPVGPDEMLQMEPMPEAGYAVVVAER